MAKAHIVMKQYHTGSVVVDEVVSSRKKAIQHISEAAELPYNELPVTISFYHGRSEYHIGEGTDKVVYWIESHEVA